MWPLLLSVVLMAADPAGELPVEVRTLDGQTQSGLLLKLDDQRLVLRVGDDELPIGLDGLLAVEFASTAARPPAATQPAAVIVQLRDRSRLDCQEIAATAENAQLRLLDGAQAELATAGVEWIRFPTPSAAVTAEWERIVEVKTAGDLIVVRKGDALDYLEGIIRSIQPDVVEFELDGEVLPVKRAKVEGLRFFRPAQAELPQPICLVYRANGAPPLPAAKAEIAAAGLMVQTPGGLRLELPWDRVKRLDYSQGKIVFLSDLEWDPQLYERQAYFGGTAPIAEGLDLFAPQRDRALDGKPLVLDRRSYSKGLALHSRTRLVYRLPGAYRRFQALAGIDDRTDDQGDVRLVIEGDGRELYAANISGADRAVELDLDITGVKRLSILCDFGKDWDVADHLILAEAKVIK